MLKEESVVMKLMGDADFLVHSQNKSSEGNNCMIKIFTDSVVEWLACLATNPRARVQFPTWLVGVQNT